MFEYFSTLFKLKIIMKYLCKILLKVSENKKSSDVFPNNFPNNGTIFSNRDTGTMLQDAGTNGSKSGCFGETGRFGHLIDINY